MKVAYNLILAGLLVSAVSFAADQTDQGTTGTENSTMGTSTTSQSHVKGDECTTAKIRAKLMDNGVHTKSTKSTTGMTGTGTSGTHGTTGTTAPMAAEFITVDVDDGVVTLTGVVGTPSEQDRIITIVKEVDDVKRVVPNLQVRGKTGSLDNSTGTGTSGSTYGSHSTTGSTLNPGSSNAPGEDTNIGTETTTGSMGSTGTTGSDTTETTGSDTTGTTDSDTTGTTSSTTTSNDAALTSAVRTKLSNGGTLLPGVQIETEDGVVTLTGTVDSQGEAERLVLLVRSVPNVKSVTSNLKVRNSQ